MRRPLFWTGVLSLLCCAAWTLLPLPQAMLAALLAAGLIGVLAGGRLQNSLLFFLWMAALCLGWCALRGAFSIPLPAPLQQMQALFAQGQRQLSTRIQMLVLGKASGLLAALTVGDKGALTAEATSVLRGAGLSHMVVVSGLHLAVIVAAVERSLYKLTPRVRGLLVILVCWMMAALTGMGGSVLRAALMQSLLQLGNLTNRKGDSLTSLGFAATVLCLLNPAWAGEFGLWLSFLATAGILALAQPLSSWVLVLLPKTMRRPLYSVVQIGAVTVAAQVATAPLILSVIGSLPLWGIAANLPAAALIGLLLPLGWVTLLASAIAPTVATALGGVCRLLGLLLLRIAAVFAQLPGGMIALAERYQICWMIAFYLLVLWLLFRSASRRLVVRSVLVLLCLLFFSNTVQGLMAQHTTQMVALQNGKSMALVAGRRAVVVGAPVTHKDYLAFSRALHALGVVSIDCVLLTEGDTPRAPLAALMAEFNCKKLVGPDSVAFRVFAGSIQAEPCRVLPMQAAPLLVSMDYTPQQVTFYFDAVQVLKSRSNYAILGTDAYPLPIAAQDTTRYRFRRTSHDRTTI